LRITTGEILEATEDMKGWLMLCGDKLFATNKKSVLVMDANSLTVQSLDIEDQLSYLPDHLGMSYNKFQVVNNFLFYAGERALDVGIVDISEKKLLWTKQLENVIRQILAYDNKFCVLDARDNFYSFEYK
jgi:hypothetical protein